MANPLIAGARRIRVAASENAATAVGTAVKTFALLAVVIVCAAFSWKWAAVQAHTPWGIMLGCTLVAFILGLVGIKNPEKVEWIAPGYAVFEGVTLGIWSMYFEHMYPGIISLGVFSTFGVLGTMLFLWSSKIIKVTEKLTSLIVTSMGAICFMYIIDIVLSMFGIGLPFLRIGGPGSILISIVIVLVASFNLLLDFEEIDRAVRNGAPKHMEWYNAFGLLISLIWLYLEIVRLIANIAASSSSDD
jgi:uncharacterized YccA/Bax inhibitor family protein